MQSLEYDYTDFNGSSKADENLPVKFFLKALLDKERTMTEGRPIYADAEYIDIRRPGQTHPMVCREATYADKKRFPKHYEAFKKRVEMPIEGTPLSEWPQLSTSQVKEFSHLNIKTVEQMIAMADSDAMRFHGGLNLKRKAAEWLEAADETKLIAEKQMLQDDVSSLQAQVAVLIAAAKTAPEEVTVSETEESDTQADLSLTGDTQSETTGATTEVTADVSHDPLDDVPIKQRRSRRAAHKR